MRCVPSVPDIRDLRLFDGCLYLLLGDRWTEDVARMALDHTLVYKSNDSHFASNPRGPGHQLCATTAVRLLDFRRHVTIVSATGCVAK